MVWLVQCTYFCLMLRRCSPGKALDHTPKKFIIYFTHLPKTISGIVLNEKFLGKCNSLPYFWKYKTQIDLFFVYKYSHILKHFFIRTHTLNIVKCAFNFSSIQIFKILAPSLSKLMVFFLSVRIWWTPMTRSKTSKYLSWRMTYVSL